MTANELFLKHAEKHLHQYHGNLRWFCEAIDNNKVPPADDTRILPDVERLQRHMGLSTLSEEDELLLRFGLIVPGLVRGISAPLSVLNPERGGFSDKRLEEAATQVSRLQAALRIARRYFPQLNSNPSVALRQLAEQLAAVVRNDDAWIEVHSDLAEAEARALANRAFSLLDESEQSSELGFSILTCLANFRSEGLGLQAAGMLNRELFWPASTYRDAPVVVAKLLVERIERIEQFDRLKLNHLLLALAWTRGDVARSAFLKWRNSPPVWAARLYVPPEDYLHNAGWALDSKGGRRDLVSTSCHPIAPCISGSAPPFLVPCRIEAEASCPACGSSLAWLFDLKSVPNEFFSGDRAEAPRRVLCCLDCSCFSPAVFSRYKLDGTAVLHPATTSDNRKSFGGSPSVTRTLVLKPRPPFAAAEPFGIEDGTSLGGAPMWLQDAQYPRCPECQEVMKFLAQFDNLSMKPPEEGIYYSFFCADCHIAAVNYQQT